MAAYIVFMRERTHNPSELKIYSEKASPSKVLLYLVTLCLPQGATIL